MLNSNQLSTKSIELVFAELRDVGINLSLSIYDYPKQLAEESQQGFGIETLEIAGLDVRIASFERTLVDVLDRPDLSGSWEEIWRSLEQVEYFRLDKVVEYALLLGNATTIAKVGFFLEQHTDALMVTTEHLERLRSAIPRQRRYVDRLRGQQTRGT